MASSVERYATEHQIDLITPEVMQKVKEEAEVRLGRSFKFSNSPEQSRRRHRPLVKISSPVNFKNLRS